HRISFFLHFYSIIICSSSRVLLSLFACFGVLYQFFFRPRPWMFVFSSLLLPVFAHFAVLYHHFSLPGLVRFLSSIIQYCLLVFARFGLLRYFSFRLSAVFARSSVLYS